MYEKKVRRQEIVRNGKIQFFNVSASYFQSEQRVLNRVNFTIEAGQRIGIIGRTGSGKSTLIKLLWRYLDCCQGRILIDGQDITKCDLKSLRSQITFIAQKSSLFPGTIQENLFGENSSSMDQEAVELIHNILYELNFLQCAEQNIPKAESLKNLLSMDVGASLSHGEKQILSILKSMTVKNKIMVFDEPTASIDSKATDKLVQVMNGENSLNKNATIIMVAHQLKTLTNCDRIFRMLKGGIFTEIVGEEFDKIISLGRQGHSNSERNL